MLLHDQDTRKNLSWKRSGDRLSPEHFPLCGTNSAKSHDFQRNGVSEQSDVFAERLHFRRTNRNENGSTFSNIILEILDDGIWIF